VERADEFFKAVPVDDLSEGEGKVVQAGLKKVALFNLEGEYHAIQNFCPHAGGFLGMGTVSGDCVRCPRHAWKFEIKTGKCLTNPRYEVRRYPTKVEDGWVWVGIPTDGGLL
jgi:NAD(P)H-dependent nitrite reductase small subunit